MGTDTYSICCPQAARGKRKETMTKKKMNVSPSDTRSTMMVAGVPPFP